MKYLNKYWWLYQLDKLLKRPNVNNGFIDYEPSGLDEIHFKGKTEILGNTKTILRPDGDWRPYRPEGELQARNTTETMSCVSFSATSAIEEIVLYLNYLVEKNEANEEQKGIVEVFKHFGILRQENGVWRANGSDRYIAKLSNTTYRGNTQKNVADAIRHYGLVPETDWPWVEGWDNYFSPVAMKVQDKGIKLTDYIEFNYEFAMFNIAPDSLRYAPLQTSVFAWNGTQNGVYYRTTLPRNHATIRDAVDASRYYILDSYDPFAKETTKNFSFGNDLIFTLHLKKKLELYNQEKVNELIARGFKYVMRTDKANGGKGEIYELKDGQLVELTLTDKLNEMVKNLAEQKDLTGISEELYRKLVNLI